MRRCSSTNRWRPYSLSVQRIGVVQRLKTMSTTGAIGQASSGVVPVTFAASSHYFPLGTYYTSEGNVAPMITVMGATGNVGQPLVQALASAGEEVRAVSRRGPFAGDLSDAASLRPA